MMTVNEVSKLTGVSIRTLQYYDTIGLLKPIEYTESGYRLYDDTSLERLQQILLFKELEFPLKEIKKIIDAPGGVGERYTCVVDGKEIFLFYEDNNVWFMERAGA